MSNINSLSAVHIHCHIDTTGIRTRQEMGNCQIYAVSIYFEWPPGEIHYETMYSITERAYPLSNKNGSDNPTTQHYIQKGHTRGTSTYDQPGGIQKNTSSRSSTFMCTS